MKRGRIYDDITQTIGATPLIRLRSLTAGLAGQVVVKHEGYNPFNSVKDRIGAAMIEDACRVIEHRDFADLFGADALAEVPLAAVVGDGMVVAGTVDRLLIRDDRVLVADFKTGRRVPAGNDTIPPSHLRQMAAYRAALRIIFRDRPIEAALIYTAGPVLFPLSDALLDDHAPAGG